MSIRNLLIATATICVIVAAWWISQEKAPTTEVTSRHLYPGLIDQLNDVQRISVETGGNRTELVKNEGGWALANRDNFPANFSTVKSTLLKLAEVRIIEQKTSKAENYQKLGVDGIEHDGSATVLVHVQDRDGGQLAALLIGNERSGSKLGDSNYYVREPDAASALLVEGELDVSANPQDWVETKVVDVATERVRKITINRNQETPIVVSKQKRDENFFTLQAIPPGFTAKSRAVVSSLGALLLDVKFQDVAAAQKVDGVLPRTIAEVQTFDGLVATLEQIDFRENVYVRFRFEFNPDIVVPKDNKDETAATTEGEAEAQSNEQNSVAEEVSELNARADDWVYVLPDYKIRMLDKNFDDMIKPSDPEPKAVDETKAE